MKPMFRTVFVALLAVLALGAIASASSASAAACTKKASGTAQVCIAGTKLTTGTAPLTVTLTKGTSAVVALRGGVIKVICEKAKTDGEPTLNPTGGIAKLEWTFSSCFAEQNEERNKCSVPEQWRTHPLKTTLSGSPEGEHITLEGEESRYFFELELGNYPPHGSCLEKALNEFYGTVKCQLKEAEVEQVVKTLACKRAWGTFEATGPQAAQFGIEETLELAGEHKGQKFSVIED